MSIKTMVSLKQSESGQALLVVVLITVIVLAVGLSAITRTITNLRNSAQEASSQKALSAAEAGIEQALKNKADVGKSFTGSSNAPSYTATYTQVSTTSKALNGGNLVAKDDGVYVWLVDHASSFNGPGWTNTLNIYWGTPTDTCNRDPKVNTAAGLEIAVISGPKGSPTVKRAAVDDRRCSRNNNLTSGSNPASQPISGMTFTNQTSVNISNGLLVRIIPLYASTYVAVGGPGLPSQGTLVTSTGTSQDGEIKRKIEVYQSYPELPTELFPYSLFVPR